MSTCVLSCLLCFNKCPRIPFLGCEKELVRTLVESTFAKKTKNLIFSTPINFKLSQTASKTSKTQVGNDRT